jgi:GAF domain-containing protein
MLTVSRAVLRAGDLSTALDQIAAEATRVVAGADRSSIVLIEGSERRFRLAGSHGLSEEYRRRLATGEARLRPGEGPSGVAYVERAPVIVTDLDADPRIASWPGRDIARQEGYRAIASFPLVPDGRFVGTLNLYRAGAGPWPDRQVQVLAFFAEHAAHAVRTAQLLDQRAKQVLALRRLVRGLRDQMHEHANRLHVIGGLLALGETAEAQTFVQGLERTQLAIREALDAHIHVPIVAGLVLAETVAAAQRGVTLTVDETSLLRRLPPALSDTQIVTILGNLLDNAFDAVAELPPDRREVRLRVDDRGEETVLVVADRGDGPTPAHMALFEHGVSGKPGHQGIGLALVSEAVTAAMGRISLERAAGETAIRVTVPNG